MGEFFIFRFESKAKLTLDIRTCPVHFEWCDVNQSLNNLYNIVYVVLFVLVNLPKNVVFLDECWSVYYWQQCEGDTGGGNRLADLRCPYGD